MSEQHDGDGPVVGEAQDGAVLAGVPSLSFQISDMQSHLSVLSKQCGLVPSICQRPTMHERQMLMCKVLAWDDLKKHRGLLKGIVPGLTTSAVCPMEGAGPRVKASKAKSNAAGRQYTSRYRGVHQTFPTKRWEAQFRRNGKPTSLGCFDREDDAARAYDKMMLWCEIHQAGGVKGGITNFDISEYEKDFTWLQEISQDELIEALRSEGRHQAAHRNVYRSGRRDGSTSGPQSEDDMGGYSLPYRFDRQVPKRRRSNTSTRGGSSSVTPGAAAALAAVTGIDALYGAAAVAGAGVGDQGSLGMLQELLQGPVSSQQMALGLLSQQPGVADGGIGLAQLLPPLDVGQGLAAMAEGAAAAADGGVNGHQQQHQQQQQQLDEEQQQQQQQHQAVYGIGGYELQGAADMGAGVGAALAAAAAAAQQSAAEAANQAAEAAAAQQAAIQALMAAPPVDTAAEPGTTAAAAE